jgi:hypothetical protein
VRGKHSRTQKKQSTRFPKFSITHNISLSIDMAINKLLVIMGFKRQKKKKKKKKKIKEEPKRKKE